MPPVKESMPQEFLTELKLIRRYLEQKPSGDRRIWEPDETCKAFLLEDAFNATATARMFHFRVPSNLYGVIASICSTATGLNSKPTGRFVLVRGQAATGTFDTQIISTTGSLTDAQEIIGGVHIPGFVSSLNMGQRPCRIQLPPDEYEVWFDGPASNVALSLFGWTFPNYPKT